MDPKSLSNLDPKLRETYERIMGTSGDNTAPPAPASEENPALIESTPTDTQPSLSPIPPVTPTPPQTQTPEELSTTNPFATPAFEAIDTNPANSATTTTPTLNPDGLSSAFPTMPAPNDASSPVQPPTETSPFVAAMPQAQPVAPVGETAVDTSTFTLNPMGQKTDLNSLQQAPAPVTPVTPEFPPPEATAAVASPAAGFNISQPKPASPVLRILYIVAGVVFFLIYTFFWLRLFKIPLPF
jgi:hypothetical protein